MQSRINLISFVCGTLLGAKQDYFDVIKFFHLFLCGTQWLIARSLKPVVLYHKDSANLMIFTHGYQLCSQIGLDGLQKFLLHSKRA